MEHLDPIDPERIESAHTINQMPPPGNPTTSVSVFGQGGNMDDFPVLKAFQQYIDAEQAKARKRMVGLSIFFVSLLFLVVVAFVFMMMHMNSRNQQLSDRLFEMAFNRPASQPVVNVQQPQAVSPAADLKPVLDKMESLVKAVTERPQTIQPAPIVVTAPQVAPAVPQQSVENVETVKLRKELDALKKKMAEDEAKELAEKKEAERLRKVEEHRRRLYPEYYANQDKASAPQVRPITSTPPQVRPITSTPPQVRPITSTPPQVRPITSSPVKDSGDKDLQELLKTATVNPSNGAKKQEDTKQVFKGDKQKVESLDMGEGMQMLLPAL